MQASTSPPEIPPHIVVLADSSVALASEWDHVVVEYLFPMFKALMHSPSGKEIKPRIAIVIYASADVRPSPLVSKQFFSEPQHVLRELQTEPSKLGIGQYPDGRQGLAALEGFVAAIELLDVIRESIPIKDPQGLVFHIFHLAASHKDAAARPRWNDSPTLDDVHWDSIPSELRKRSIHLSTILLNKLPEFSELYTQSTPDNGITQPWFATRAAHQVLIASVGNASQSGSKRPNDLPSSDRPLADTKRPKPSPSISDKGSPMRAPPSGQLQNTSPVSKLQKPTQAAPTMTQATPMPSSVPGAQQLEHYRRLLEIKIQEIRPKMDTARAKGDVQEAENLKRELEKHAQNLLMMRNFMKSQRAAADEQTQPSASIAPSAPATASPALAAQKPPPTQQDNNNALPPVNITSNPDSHVATTQSIPPKIISSAVPTSQFPGSNMQHAHPAAGSSISQITAQAPTKLLGHQRQRSLQSSLAGDISPNPSPSLLNRATPVPATAETAQVNMNSTIRKVQTPSWQGTFNWSGVDPNTQERKDVQTSVFAYMQDPSQCRPDTWPMNMTLSPTTDRAVSMQELQVWIKRFSPGLCTFQVQALEGRQNEFHYRSLVSLLTAKNIYATASWTTPNGGQTANMLIFPVNNLGLAGAVFPISGIPELPKPSLQASGAINSGVSQRDMMQHLSRMTPEQRQAFMANLAKQRQFQAQFAQQGSGHNLNMQALTMASRAGNIFGSPSLGTAAQHAMPTVVPILSQSHGGLSADAMQSFLQNNINSSSNSAS